jgi:hypothetical protein
MDTKEALHHYLRRTRGERPPGVVLAQAVDLEHQLTPTGTNLLGLVRHVATVQLGYFSAVFDRPFAQSLALLPEEGEDDEDMWVGPDVTRQEVLDLHELSGAHSDATIEALPLDAPGRVPWWPAERRAVTLGLVLVHVVNETARHAGHADILRELIDGQAGRMPADPSLPERSAQEWAAYRERVAVAAGAAS